MYLYVFDRRYGGDRVVRCEVCEVAAGDLVKRKDVRLLALGEEIAFPERVSYRRTDALTQEHVQEKSVLKTKTLQLLHRFVNEWFTTYKNTVPLFLPQDVALLLLRKKKKKSSLSVALLGVTENIITTGTEHTSGQQLIVFPDLRTLLQMTPVAIREDPRFVVLHGKSTEKQKAEAFRGIKSGSIQTVLCTYSQLFQDWHALSSIILIDQHTRRYKNQQDPRYYVPTVIDYMASLYGAALIKTGISPLAKE